MIEVIEDAPSQAVDAELILLHAVKEPRLVACAAHRDVESLFVHGSCQRLVTRVWRDQHAHEHHVAFVTLKRVRVATSKAPSCEYFSPKTFQQQLLDALPLLVALQADDAKIGVLIVRMLVTGGDRIHNRPGFHVVDVSASEAVGQIGSLERVQAIPANLPKRN